VIAHWAMPMNADRNTCHGVVLITSEMLAVLALKLGNVGDGCDMI